jgi:hypothetical protein
MHPRPVLRSVGLDHTERWDPQESDLNTDPFFTKDDPKEVASLPPFTALSGNFVPHVSKSVGVHR